ncbi:hypothetical protein ALP29_200417 [Pseudomonas syringae pv. avii]|uniref:Fimbrial-type adhesion domain-containing protein n=1 Tax=Pseudomonas syringae pv. avii TaxID=663959 RepID=A0A3M5VNT4_PSESX|nr:DUF1120 domain-containing protein [Pseudomonas azotoformans]RMT64915.1 hypothetical protein ALP43_200157 [Pseudomonas azotoformans]RMU59047.1 hypothetical protein ALP29_200417 [Pseudomonas syringae pv. avii]
MKMLFAPLVLGLVFGHYAEANSQWSGEAPGIPPALPIDTRCSLTAGGGVVDYGTLSRWQLQDAQTGHNNVTFGKRTLTINVACPFSQIMRLTVRGERSIRGDFRYGNRGSMIVRLFDAQIDGESVQIASNTPDGIIKGAVGDSVLLRPSESFSAISNGQLAKGKTFTARLEIDPTLPEADARVSAHEVNEANLTIELMN